MPDPKDLADHLELIGLREHGSWVVAREAPLRSALLDQLSRTSALSKAASALVDGMRRGDTPADFDGIFVRLLGDRASFSHPAQWTLYWALSKAAHGILDEVEAGCHEPRLTGSLIGRIRTALGQVEAPGQMTGDMFEDVIGFHFADHEAGWKESTTGADFGVIVEIRRGPDIRYVVTLVQAKRMTGPKAVDLDQLEAVYVSGIGSYLFYNETMFGGASHRATPTMKSADLVKVEMGCKKSVDPFALAGDFAVRLALELPSSSPPAGAMSFRSPHEALVALYALDRQVRIDQILVTVLGERRFTRTEVVGYERAWRSLVDRARRNVRAGRKPFEDGPRPSPESNDGPGP